MKKYYIFSLSILIVLIGFSMATYSEFDLSSNQTYIKSQSNEGINVGDTIFQSNADKLDNSEIYIKKSKEELYDYISKYRAQQKILPVTINIKLDSAAQKFAKYMSDTGVLTHYDDQGKDGAYRISQEGLPFSYRGEIVSSSIDFSGAIQARKDSKGHREIFNSSKYNNIGVGYYKGMRVIMYYYSKEYSNVNKAQPIAQSKKLVKSCSIRNYKKGFNKNTKKTIWIKTTCKKYINK